MSEVTIIGVDLAKHVFQVHGARADGSVAWWPPMARRISSGSPTPSRTRR